MKNGKMRSCVALVTAVSLAGCSYLTVKGPADPSGQTPPTCKTDVDSPWLDAVSAGSFVIPGIIAGIMAANCGEGESTDEELCNGATLGVVGSGVAILVLALSASNGYSKVRKCKRAHENWEMRRPQPTYEPPTNVRPPSMGAPGARPPAARPPAARPPVTQPAAPPPATPAPAPAPVTPAPTAPPAAAPGPATPAPTTPPATTPAPPASESPDFWKKKDS